MHLEMRIAKLIWKTASGLPLLQPVVTRNAPARDFLLHPVRRVLVLLNPCGWHAVLRLPKVNFLVLWGSREAVVEIPLVGHASIVAGKATSLVSVPLQERVEPAILQTHQLLLLAKMGGMVKIPNVAS